MSRPEDILFRLIRSDPWRLQVLDTLHRVAGSKTWVAAGFVRNLVWDDLQGHGPQQLEDVDVLTWWPASLDRELETRLESLLKAAAPEIPWSVRNQARMHLRNHDTAYTDLGDAMANWLETATGVAIRMDDAGDLHLLASYGLGDLMAGVLRPTARGAERLEMLEERIEAKGWLRRWPAVTYRKDAPGIYAGQAMESKECRD